MQKINTFDSFIIHLALYGRGLRFLPFHQKSVRNLNANGWVPSAFLKMAMFLVEGTSDPRLIEMRHPTF
jgi:hypothetical protein